MIDEKPKSATSLLTKVVSETEKANKKAAAALEAISEEAARLENERDKEQALLQIHAKTRTTLMNRDELGLIPDEDREKFVRWGWLSKTRKEKQ